jgi:hypothetical protein
LHRVEYRQNLPRRIFEEVAVPEPAANPAPASPQFTSQPGVRSATSIDGVRSDPTTTPARQLWEADQRALEKMDPWRDTQNVVIGKNPDGTLFSRPRTPGGQNGAPGAGDQQPPQPQPQSQPGPAASDGTKLRVGDYELSPDDIKGLMERRALEQSRKATLPASPDKYLLQLPPDFKMPDGMAEWRFDVNHPVQGPLLARAQQIAHENGMSQEGFSRMLALHVANEVQQQQMFDRAKAAELNKLGEMAGVRVDAVRTFVRSMVGDAAPALLMVLEQAPVASTIVGFEKLMRAFSSQGLGGFPGAARDGGDLSRGPQKVSDELYAKMTFFEKQQYAAQFDQSGR